MGLIYILNPPHLFATSNFEDMSLMEEFALLFGTLEKWISIIWSTVKNTMAVKGKISL